MFRVHKSECKKNVKHFKTKNSLKYKKKNIQLTVVEEDLVTECLFFISDQVFNHRHHLNLVLYAGNLSQGKLIGFWYPYECN